MGQRETRISSRRQREIPQRPLEPILRRAEQTQPPLHIQLIGQLIPRRAFLQQLLFVVRQGQPQSRADFAHNFFVQGNQVASLPRVLAPPKLPPASRVHQFRADGQRVAALRDAPSQHRAHVQLAPQNSRVGILPFVTMHAVRGCDVKFFQLPQAVDDAFRNAPAQVFHFRVAGLVLKWHHRQRIDISTPGVDAGSAGNSGRRRQLRRIGIDCLQRRTRLARSLVALRRIFAQASQDHRTQSLRNARRK